MKNISNTPVCEQPRKCRYRKSELAGKVSDVVYHLDSLFLSQGTRVFLHARVSGHVQNKNENLQEQVDNLTTTARRRGLVIGGILKHVGPSSDLSLLMSTLDCAHQKGIKHILAETTDRFMRPSEYSKTNQQAKLKRSDINYLHAMTQGYTLITVAHPDATSGENRGVQTKRGKMAKKKKREVDRRPGYKYRLRCRWEEEVIRLIDEEKMNYTEVAKLIQEKEGTSVASYTISRWYREGKGDH